MGLLIKAVSADYHYDKKQDEYVGEEFDSGVEIGYIAFFQFCTNLLKVTTNYQIRDFNYDYHGQKLNYVYWHEPSKAIALDAEEMQDAIHA